MKTKKELDEIRQRVDDLRKELRELTPDELQSVTGGSGDDMIFTDPDDISNDTKNKFIG